MGKEVACSACSLLSSSITLHKMRLQRRDIPLEHRLFGFERFGVALAGVLGGIRNTVYCWIACMYKYKYRTKREMETDSATVTRFLLYIPSVHCGRCTMHSCLANSYQTRCIASTSHYNQPHESSLREKWLHLVEDRTPLAPTIRTEFLHDTGRKTLAFNQSMTWRLIRHFEPVKSIYRWIHHGEAPWERKL